MTYSKLFLRGIPTEPDVARLMEAFGVPAEDAPIPYQAAADVIHTPVTASRFKTVTKAWRDQLRLLHGIEMQARESAFVVRDPDGRVTLMGTYARSMFRRARRVVEVGISTDAVRLTDKGRVRRDTCMRMASGAHLAMLAERIKPAAPALRAVGEKPVA